MTFVLDVILVVLMAVIVLIYAKRGLVNAVFGLVSVVAAFVLAYFVGPVLGNTVIRPLLTNVESTVFDTLLSMVERVDGSLDIAGLLSKLPQEFVDLITRCGADLVALQDAFGSIALGTEADLQAMAQTIAASLTEYISIALGSVIVFLIVSLVMLLLKKIILPIFRLPILKQANGLLGGILGAVIAFGIAWFLCVALSAVTGLGVAGEHTETLASLTQSSYLFRFFCNLSPQDLLNIPAFVK